MTPEKLDELEREFEARRNNAYQGHDSALGHLFWLYADDLIAAARREAALREALNHIVAVFDLSADEYEPLSPDSDEIIEARALLSEVPQ